MYNPGLEAFLAIYRTRNLSRAAAELNVAQSTISKRLQVLEQEIGISLIERGRGYKSVQLTSSGEIVADLAKRWNAIWQETQELKVNGPKLSLSIAVIDSMINAVFPLIYKKLRMHAPPIRLKVSTTHSFDAYEEIDRRSSDISFSLIERDLPSVVVNPCYSEEMVVLRIAASSPMDSDTVHPKELDPDFELYIPWTLGFRLWHEKWWDPLCNGRTYVDTAQLVLQLLQTPEEWAILPYSIAKQAQARGNFDIFHLADRPPERVVYKLIHKYPSASSLPGIELFESYLNIVLKNDFGYLTCYS